MIYVWGICKTESVNLMKKADLSWKNRLTVNKQCLKLMWKKWSFYHLNDPIDISSTSNRNVTVLNKKYEKNF